MDNITFTGIHDIRSIRMQNPITDETMCRIGFNVSDLHWDGLKKAYLSVKEDFSDIEDVHNVDFSLISRNGKLHYFLNENLLEMNDNNLKIFSCISKMLSEIANMPKKLINITKEFFETKTFENFVTQENIETLAMLCNTTSGTVFVKFRDSFIKTLCQPLEIKENAKLISYLIHEDVKEFVEV